MKNILLESKTCPHDSFNGNVNGLKSFDTSSWASGVYVIRGVAEGQTFTKVYNH